MLYSEDGKHLILDDYDFRHIKVDRAGYRRLGGACDLRRVDKDLLGEDRLAFGASCIFPPELTTGKECKFGARCLFGGDDRFGPGNSFEYGCRFMPGCIFGEGCTMDGHVLIGRCPVMIVQMPMIMWPIYFVNTEDGIMWYSRGPLASLDEHGVFSEWVVKDCEHMERELTTFVKEAYEKSTKSEVQQEEQGRP